VKKNKMPGSREVERALRQTLREIKAALKEINQQAGKLVMRGDYAVAEELVSVGRTVTTFGAEVEALQSRWLDLQESATKELTIERTPLWEYYKPILVALVELGGDATLSQVEEKVEPILGGVLNPGELSMMSGDKLSWKRAVRRARRHMVKEGFLEDHSGLRWRITDQGRSVATETSSLKEMAKSETSSKAL
jgi:hypothetical protein